jgi:hypothetical protein
MNSPSADEEKKALPQALKRSANWLIFMRAWNRLRKNWFCEWFVSGHDFSRAEKSFIFVIPSGLQPARNLLFGLFPAACGRRAPPLLRQALNPLQSRHHLQSRRA